MTKWKTSFQKYLLLEDSSQDTGRANAVYVIALVTAVTAGAFRFFTDPGPAGNVMIIAAILFALTLLYAYNSFQKRIYLAEKKKAEDRGAVLAQHEKLLRVINDAAVMLLTYEEDKFEHVLLKSMEMMAKHAGVDQIHIWENSWRDGLLCYTELFEWKEGIGLRHGVRKPLESSYRDNLTAWEKLFNERKCINGPIASFPKEERLTLSPYGIVSILAVPVYLNDEDFWGFISFDDCRQEREFSQEDVDILKSGSLLLVNAIVRYWMSIKMRQAEERIRTQLNAMPLSCVLIDKNMNVLDCNEEALKIFKPPHKRHYMEDFFSYSPPRQPDGSLSEDKAREYVAQAFRRGREVFEWMHQTHGGELLPVELTLVLVRISGEDAVAWYVRDLREHKEMMSSLDRRLEQQELMFDIARSFISREKMSVLVADALRRLGEFLHVSRVRVLVLDKNGAVPDIDNAWYSSEEFSGAPMDFSGVISTFPVTMPWRGDVSLICCSDVCAEEKYAALESTGLKAFIWAPLYVDGKYWGMLSVGECTGPRVWSESDRQLVGMISSAISGAVFRGIFEQERADALTHAESASKAKGDFLSNMSHEIRTPMNAIIGMTAIGKAAGTAKKKDYALEKIESASTHLLGVINDILDISKIEANKLELSFADFDFEGMLQKVVNVINFKVEEKKQAFRLSINPAIPRMLSGDDQRLAQVIANLLSNAVKFTPEEGSIRLSADLLEKLEKEDDFCTLKISVADTGIGITKEQQAHLFTSFEQAETGTFRKFGGTGLGLAISKRLVEMMGGSIWIESEPGKGAAFTFTARVQLSKKSGKECLNLNAPEEPDNETSSGEAADDFEGCRILLAEDVDINREIVQILLEPTKVSIDSAENGAEALRLFAAEPSRYDMILMDVQMPEMDGYEATRRIRALDVPNAKNIPIVAMTANVFKQDIDKCLEAGMDDHLGKPLDTHGMIAALRKYLKR